MNLLSKWNEWEDTIKRLKNVSDQKVFGDQPNDVTCLRNMKCQHLSTAIIPVWSLMVSMVTTEQDGDQIWTLNGDQRYNEDGSVSDPTLPLSGDNICTRRET